MNVQQSKRLAEAPESCRKTLARAYSGKSKATALKAKCLDCSNFQREEITNCTVFGCPLHPYRPYQNKEKLTLDKGE